MEKVKQKDLFNRLLIVEDFFLGFLFWIYVYFHLNETIFVSTLISIFSIVMSNVVVFGVINIYNKDVFHLLQKSITYKKVKLYISFFILFLILQGIILFFLLKYS